MIEMRVFDVSKETLKNFKKSHPKCLVCHKNFELGDKIVLAPIQQPKKGWASVQSIPIHEDCYWIEK